MIACPNKECANYKQELDVNLEFCPLCGAKPEEFKAKSNTTLGAIAVIAGFVGLLMLYMPYIWYGAFAVSPGSIVAAFISKTKFAVLLTILLFAATAGIFIMFVKPF